MENFQEKKLINYDVLIGFLFVNTYASKALTDAIFVAKEISSPLVNIKYLFALLLILAFILKKRNCINLDLFKKYDLIFVTCAFFTLYSFLFQIINRHFSLTPIEYDIKLLLAPILAYCVYSSLDSKKMYSCMVFVLIFAIIGFLLEKGIDTFSIENFKAINFINSYSPFESHYFAGISIAVCTYFNFNNKNKVVTLISTLFPILTFKRLAILFALLVFVLGRFKKVKEIELKTRSVYYFASCFIILTLIYYYFLIPTNQNILSSILHSDLSVFTKGRSEYMHIVLDSSFVNFGLGSCEFAIGKNLEMELIQFFIETSIIGLSLFCFAYWKIAGKNIFSILLMTFIFLNMLTSHGIYNSFNTMIYLLLIEEFNSKNQKKNLSLYQKLS